MSSTSTEFREIWVRRKGVSLDRTRWKVKNTRTGTLNYYRLETDDFDFVVPMEDYEQCDPPVVDVTTKLRVVDGKVYCNESDFSPDDHIATLCCDGKYRVSFNPFKVEKIR